ncbi:MAG: hypothetical protein L6R28_23265 [Planctomycetes bacterium]|nr:hypothetical protein [Planctomycetota bacterium]
MEVPFNPQPSVEELLQQQAESHTDKLQRLELMRSIDDLGYLVYAVLFALASALLLAAVFWPRERRLTLAGWRDERDALDARGLPEGLGRMPVAVAGLLLLLMMSAVSQQIAIDQNRGFIKDAFRRMEKELREAEAKGEQAREQVMRSHYKYLPERKSLHYLSLGNTAIAADYVWLTSLQYVSSPFRQGKKFDLLHKFYTTLQDLSPHWIEALVNAGNILSALDPDRYKTEQFLARAVTDNPHDWRLPERAARLFVVPPSNPDLAKEYARRAVIYFERALARDSLPDSKKAQINETIGYLQKDSGQWEVASKYLWSLAHDPLNPMPMRERCSQQWLQAESMLRADFFQKAVNYFHRHQGRWPESIQEAARFALQKPPGALPPWFGEAAAGALPLDAYGLPILLDSKNGKVTSRGVQAQAAVQARAVLDMLIHMFRAVPAVNDRPPRSLAELTHFVRFVYNKKNPPPFSVAEALGEDLDCERNPLGGRWDYNPATGEINLPPDCEPKLLLRNRMAAVENWDPPHFDGAEGHPERPSLTPHQNQ